MAIVQLRFDREKRMATCRECSFRVAVIEADGPALRDFCRSSGSHPEGRSRGFIFPDTPSCSQLVRLDAVKQRFGAQIDRILAPPSLRPGARVLRVVEFGWGPRGRLDVHDQLTGGDKAPGAVEPIDPEESSELNAALRAAFADESFRGRVSMLFRWSQSLGRAVAVRWERFVYDGQRDMPGARCA